MPFFIDLMTVFGVYSNCFLLRLVQGFFVISVLVGCETISFLSQPRRIEQRAMTETQ
jgi:hypothetical protein